MAPNQMDKNNCRAHEISGGVGAMVASSPVLIPDRAATTGVNPTAIAHGSCNTSGNSGEDKQRKK